MTLVKIKMALSIVIKLPTYMQRIILNYLIAK